MIVIGEAVPISISCANLTPIPFSEAIVETVDGNDIMEGPASAVIATDHDTVVQATAFRVDAMNAAAIATAAMDDSMSDTESVVSTMDGVMLSRPRPPALGQEQLQLGGGPASSHDEPQVITEEDGIEEAEAIDEAVEVAVLVVGESGDGKSTLVRAMVDPIHYANRGDELPEVLDLASANANGTTCAIGKYRGMALKGTVPPKRLVIYDTPGIGTEQCPIEEIVAKIKALFKEGIELRAILVTTPSTTTTPSTGAAIVRMLLAEGICGEEEAAWKHVIFVGTKEDEANAAKLNRFKTAIVPKFFEGAPQICQDAPLYCLTKAIAWDENHNATDVDVGPVLQCISQLPDLDDGFFFKTHNLTDEVLSKVASRLLPHRTLVLHVCLSIRACVSRSSAS